MKNPLNRSPKTRSRRERLALKSLRNGCFLLKFDDLGRMSIKAVPDDAHLIRLADIAELLAMHGLTLAPIDGGGGVGR